MAAGQKEHAGLALSPKSQCHDPFLHNCPPPSSLREEKALDTAAMEQTGRWDHRVDARKGKSGSWEVWFLEIGLYFYKLSS